jgi:hypothetical protein
MPGLLEDYLGGDENYRSQVKQEISAVVGIRPTAAIEGLAGKWIDV